MQETNKKTCFQVAYIAGEIKKSINLNGEIKKSITIEGEFNPTLKLEGEFSPAIMLESSQTLTKKTII